MLVCKMILFSLIPKVSHYIQFPFFKHWIWATSWHPVEDLLLVLVHFSNVKPGPCMSLRLSETPLSSKWRIVFKMFCISTVLIIWYIIIIRFFSVSFVALTLCTLSITAHMFFCCPVLTGHYCGWVRWHYWVRFEGQKVLEALLLGVVMHTPSSINRSVLTIHGLFH